MIKDFMFSTPPKIIFGAGKLKELPSVIRSIDRNIILVTGKNSFRSSTYGLDLLDTLRSDKFNYKHVIISGEPSPEVVDSAVSELSGFNAGVVVAIGGGSVLDAGKAISAMILMKESVTGYLDDIGTKEHPGIKVPFIAIPTTSGTGSEATKNAVLSRPGDNGFKKSLRHDNFMPDIALIDPELTVRCSRQITAASGMDCFTQLVESYISTKSNPLTDAITLEGIKAIRNSLVKCYMNGDDIEARSEMSLAALCSGIGLANAGLGAVHGIAGAIGGIYEIPHGLLCGTLMAACNEITVRKLKQTGSNPGAIKKYISLGRFFLNSDDKSDEYYINGFLDYLRELTVILNLPGLKSAGIAEESFDAIIRSSSSKNNPVDLSNEEMSEVLTMRYV